MLLLFVFSPCPSAEKAKARKHLWRCCNLTRKNPFYFSPKRSARFGKGIEPILFASPKTGVITISDLFFYPGKGKKWPLTKENKGFYRESHGCQARTELNNSGPVIKRNNFQFVYRSCNRVLAVEKAKENHLSCSNLIWVNNSSRKQTFLVCVAKCDAYESSVCTTTWRERIIFWRITRFPILWWERQRETGNLVFPDRALGKDRATFSSHKSPFVLLQINPRCSAWPGAAARPRGWRRWRRCSRRTTPAGRGRSPRSSSSSCSKRTMSLVRTVEG